MASRLSRFAGIAAGSALVVIVLTLAVAFVPTLIGYESLIATSGSMEPGMPVGSVALTRPMLVRAVSVGDVVSFRRPGHKETITHRVVAVERQGDNSIFTTKGDANSSTDTDRIVVRGRIHRVERVVPFAGYVVRYARSPLGGVLLFVVPILGLTRDRLTRGRHRRHVRDRADNDEAGWSATTFAFVRVTPGAIRSEPGG
jgi:signal peptidase I